MTNGKSILYEIYCSLVQYSSLTDREPERSAVIFLSKRTQLTKLFVCSFRMFPFVYTAPGARCGYDQSSISQFFFRTPQHYTHAYTVIPRLTSDPANDFFG